MILKSWDSLPEKLKRKEVRPYYDVLIKRKGSLIIKGMFDFVVALIILLVSSPIFLILAIAIKLDSPGPVFFRQVRVTQYGREFKIFKFRTMVANAEKMGTQVTVENDNRITKVGNFIRDYRLDEIPQVLNVLNGTMSFVGTRPEVPKYVRQYTPEMFATLLLPAGITSLASIKYKDEAELLSCAIDADKTYVKEVLPGKMKYNLQAIQKFSFWEEIKLMFMTVFTVLKK